MLQKVGCAPFEWFARCQRNSPMMKWVPLCTLICHFICFMYFLCTKDEWNMLELQNHPLKSLLLMQIDFFSIWISHSIIGRFCNNNWNQVANEDLSVKQVCCEQKEKYCSPLELIGVLGHQRGTLHVKCTGHPNFIVRVLVVRFPNLPNPSKTQSWHPDLVRVFLVRFPNLPCSSKTQSGHPDLVRVLEVWAYQRIKDIET